MDREKQIVDLRRRASDIETRLAELATKRKEFALGAVEGNKASLKAIQELDSETDALRRERDTFMAAIDQAEHLMAEQEREVVEKDRRQREASARIFSDRVLKLDDEIDIAMGALRQLLEKRAAVIRQLAGTGIVDKLYALKLLQNSGPTSAAHAAGLRKFIGLDHVPPPRIVPLAQGDRSLSRAASESDERAA